MLNKQQLEASEIKDERVLVLAGPGTGKTTTLISRYDYLLSQGITPDQIICCTFSRKAADEIKVEDLNIDIKPRLEILKVEEPKSREAGIMVKSVDEMIEKLKNEAKVI